MKPQKTISILLLLGALLWPAGTAQAQQPFRRSETGMITLGPNQEAWITITSGASGTGNGAVTFRFRVIEYMQQSCNGALCKYVPGSPMITDPLTLAPGEAARIVISSTTFSASSIVQNGGQGTRNLASIVDTSTGKVVSVWEF